VPPGGGQDGEHFRSGSSDRGLGITHAPYSISKFSGRI
jgi:hypothetical protein